MVNDLRDRVDLWLQRTKKDMKSVDGQGYIYGLRMFTAFARVLQQCLLAHKVAVSASSSASAPAPAPNYFSCCAPCLCPAPAPAPAHNGVRFGNAEEVLSIRNEIAQNRCNCEECVRLKQSNKLHLASLPIWLCMNYHNKRLMLHPDVEKRKEELIKLYDNFPSRSLSPKDVEKFRTFTADLFCVWPHCKNYELKRYEWLGWVTSLDRAVTYEAAKKYLDEHSDLKNYDYMVVKIDLSRQSVFDVIVVRSAVAQGAAESSSKDDYDAFLRLYNHIADDHKQDKESMFEALGEDKMQLNEHCSPKVSEVNKLHLLIKILKHSVTREDKTSAKLATFDGTDLNILVSTIVQKFGARAQERGNIETQLKRKLAELSDGCVECFRDECISFMSDLRHVVLDFDDWNHYSKCQNTIAQCVGNIKIDLYRQQSPDDKKSDEIEQAILQWFVFTRCAFIPTSLSPQCCVPRIVRRRLHGRNRSSLCFTKILFGFSFIGSQIYQ
jgi:hypothetical protein